MKDIGIAVDRRTLPKDTIPHNFEHLHSKGPASPVIDKDLRGPDLGSRILPANHATGMVSKEDHEVQALLQRMSLEEQVSAIYPIAFQSCQCSRRISTFAPRRTSILGPGRYSLGAMSHGHPLATGTFFQAPPLQAYAQVLVPWCSITGTYIPQLP
jgi:hypothetical protein